MTRRRKSASFQPPCCTVRLVQISEERLSIEPLDVDISALELIGESRGSVAADEQLCVLA